MLLRRIWYCALAIGLLFVIACGGGNEPSTSPSTSAPKPAAPSANAYDPSKATASIGGKITFDGAKPNLVKLQMSADPVCMKAHTEPVMDQSIIVNDNGTLRNVFVYVKQGAEKWTYTTPTNPVELDQQGCIYHPHIVALMVNQPLKIKNNDPTLHNIHPQPKNNPEFNLGQPTQGMESEKTFATAEFAIPVKCDVHRWMEAYIHVMSNPFFAVSGEDGTFQIKNLPAGTYTIEAWHEKYGAQTQTITVADSESKTADFTFKAM